MNDYVEHHVEICFGFRVVDSTSTLENHAHDHLIWVGVEGDGGRWLLPHEVKKLAEALMRVHDSHLQRKSGSV